MKTIYTLAIALMSGVILTACVGTINIGAGTTDEDKTEKTDETIDPKSMSIDDNAPKSTTIPPNVIVETVVLPATTAFLTQTEGDHLNAGIDFDTINNEAGDDGIIGRLREIFDPVELPVGASPVSVTPWASPSAFARGVDFSIVSLGASSSEPLNDTNFAFMGFGYDGWQKVVNGEVTEGYRFAGYSGYNLANEPSVSLVANATYNGNLGVIAVSDNTATEGLRNAENRVNISTDIVLTANFTARTLTSPLTNFAKEQGSVQVNATFTAGETGLVGTVDFILPSIFTRDNNAPIRTTLQGVVNQRLVIGAFHGADDSVAIVGGFVANR
ncbi:MAG: hypothetical protein K8953_06025 [Proteobacteria bacterium]|nr:hypothetical protein [Pseudomonadota bacterium]